MISVIFGLPGQGKGMYAAYRVWNELQRGRAVFSTFGMAGARPCLTVADVLCDEFAESLFVVDEGGTEWAARKTADFDELMFTAFTQHRKGACDILIMAQNMMYLDTQIRRVTGSYIHVKRVGPSGEAARGMTKAPPWYKRPWAFIARHYVESDFDSDMNVKQVKMKGSDEVGPTPAFKTERFWFRRKYADMYSTFERVIPLDLAARVATLREGAPLRASLPAYQFERGRLKQMPLPEGYEMLSLPKKVSPKDAAKGLPAASVATLGSSPELAGKLRDLGFVLPGDPGYVQGAAPDVGSPSSGLVLSPEGV